MTAVVNVESPHKAVTQADALLARLAGDRGFASKVQGARFEEQTAALSVHHASHVRGYRALHTAVRTRGSTEEMRDALLQAQDLSDALLARHPHDTHPHHPTGSSN